MLRALADRTRRQILAMVWREERTAGEIAAGFTMTRPAVSQHLAILRESKLISERHEGTRRFYTPTGRPLPGFGRSWKLSGTIILPNSTTRTKRRREKAGFDELRPWHHHA
jgi:DNA-binding transcriptional ArsR family regulator